MPVLHGEGGWAVMVECKHDFSIDGRWPSCRKCGITLINYIHSLYGEKESLKKQLQQAEARVAELVGALEIALHDLATSHNLLATDRPDLVDLNNIISRGRAKMEPIKTVSGKDIMWMTDNSRAIDIVTKALAKAKEGECNA